MKTRTYRVELTGQSPLLLHNCDIDWQEQVKRWQKAPENKGVSVAGDDRSPAWLWLGHAYHDGQHFVVPADNLMTMLREGGAKVQVPNGKNGKTFKAQTQSGLVVDQPEWPIIGGNGQPYPVAPFAELRQQNAAFAEYAAAAQLLGFQLFTKRATVGKAKHVRVRPRFDRWAVAGTVTVFDDQITTEVFRAILTASGQYCGLCDWRPSSKTPGPFGRFSATVEELR